MARNEICLNVQCGKGRTLTQKREHDKEVIKALPEKRASMKFKGEVPLVLIWVHHEAVVRAIGRTGRTRSHDLTQDMVVTTDKMNT